ncbi:MAG TPA: hypothetical protein VLM89_15570 [Phycisphaerae bacterium]|nr:hypothetical protein [Phycisphaerae bacterium]
MKTATLILWSIGVLGGLAAVQTSVLAVCPSGMSPQVFCDDFDCYCNPSPCSQNPPGKCALDAAKANTPMRQVWVRTSRNSANNNICGSEFNIEDTLPVFSEPFGNGLPNTVDTQLGHITVIISDDIGNAYGPQYDAMLGTDIHPLVMTFNLNNQTDNKIHAANVYAELSLGTDRAPTDYVYAPDCSTYCNPPVILTNTPEIICAQNAAVPGCPSLSTAPIHASIAVGFVAKLDTDPCHCADPPHGSRNRHLAFFDGKKWWTLDEGVFPGSGNFEVYGGEGLDPILDLNGGVVTLTIKTSTVQIEYTSYLNGQYGQYSIATAPREYLGPFDALHAGFGTACELNSSSWTACAAPRRCLKGSPGAGRVIFDDFLIHGGAGASQPGACCLPNAGCVEVIEVDCLSLNGRWQGPNSMCANTFCCPLPFADADTDRDVDHVDFGAFQLCYTGPGGGVPSGCRCFNRDGDNDVDAGDFTAFNNCWSGPNVPLDVNNPPAGCTP